MLAGVTSFDTFDSKPCQKVALVLSLEFHVHVMGYYTYCSRMKFPIGHFQYRRTSKGTQNSSIHCRKKQASSDFCTL